jgi:hypothetical protein
MTQAFSITVNFTASGPTPGVGSAIGAAINVNGIQWNSVVGAAYIQDVGLTDAAAGTADSVPFGSVPAGDVHAVFVNMATDGSTLDISTATGGSFNAQRFAKALPPGVPVCVRVDGSAGIYIKGSSASVPFAYLIAQA